KDRRRDAVYHAERPERDREQRERYENDGVPEHLPHRLALTPEERRHGHARATIVALLEQREGPEMRRRPVEDDQEEIDGGEIDATGDGGPPHERRKGAGSAADH